MRVSRLINSILFFSYDILYISTFRHQAKEFLLRQASLREAPHFDFREAERPGKLILNDQIPLYDDQLRRTKDGSIPGTKFDMFSLGIIFLELLVGPGVCRGHLLDLRRTDDVNLSREDQANLYKIIGAWVPHADTLKRLRIDHTAQHLLRWLLHPLPMYRPSADQVLKRPFIRGVGADDAEAECTTWAAGVRAAGDSA